jgi:hypothetical protein
MAGIHHSAPQGLLKKDSSAFTAIFVVGFALFLVHCGLCPGVGLALAFLVTRR